MIEYTRILIGLCLVVIQVSCINASELDFTSQLSQDPLFQQVISRLNILEAENKAQQQQILDLEASNTFQLRIINTLEKNVKKLNQELDKIKTTTTGEGNNDLSSFMEFSTERNGDIKVQNKNNEVQDASNRIRRQDLELRNVAFTAILTKRLMNLGLNQNVIFNVVETNIGNGYNSHQGVFLAPLSGTYVFHVSLFALYNEEQWCKIVVNGSAKVDVYARGESSNHHDMGSQTLVVHLNQGDDVSVQNGRAGDNVFGNGNTWTTFSGFLLRSDAEITGTNIIG